MDRDHGPPQAPSSYLKALKLEIHFSGLTFQRSASSSGTLTEKEAVLPFVLGACVPGQGGSFVSCLQSRGKQSRAWGGAAPQQCWVLRDSSSFRFAEQKNVSCKELFKLHCTNGREQKGKTGVEG